MRALMWRDAAWEDGLEPTPSVHVPGCAACAARPCAPANPPPRMPRLQVVELLANSETEVIQSLHVVNHSARMMQELSKDLESFRRLDEELPPLAGMEEPSVTQESRRSSLREAATNLNDSLCLVEAVAVSPKFAAILVERRRALLRALYVVAAVKVRVWCGNGGKRAPCYAGALPCCVRVCGTSEAPIPWRARADVLVLPSTPLAPCARCYSRRCPGKPSSAARWVARA